MHERHGFVTFKGTPLTLLGQAPQIGSKAPEFAALRGDLSPFSLAQAAGKTVVINSVPSLDTPVCAMQTRRFNQEATALGSDVQIITISMDLPFAQKRWCGAAGVDKVVVVSDHRDASFGTSYGMLIKELRLLARGVLVIDKNGVLRYQQLVPEVAQEPDYEAALAAIKAVR